MCHAFKDSLAPGPIAALAPMDGFTDKAYRQIVRSLNPNVLLFSEFTNVHGILRSEKVKSRLDFFAAQAPYFVQLFGNEPELFAKIAEMMDNTGVTGIDINMGCPAKKIVRAKSGGALMKDQDLACQIVEATIKATSLPVTVKTRLGWSEPSGLSRFVRSLLDAGAAMVTVHGRTAKQQYKGEADFEPIYRLKQETGALIIGNGDLQSREHALAKLGNLDGYMIGRAAIGNPWVFWPQEEASKLSLKDKIKTMLEHFSLLRQYQNENKSLIEFRKHLTGYINGFYGAKALRRVLMQCQNERDFIKTALNMG